MVINKKLGGGTQLEWIATIRGIAALLVFISHLPLNMSYELRFVIGRIGVTAFFVISGYLAVKSRRKMSCKRYMFNRFVRIYPIYWLLLILMCIVMDKSSLSITRILANLTCFQEFLGQDNIIGASWMLPIQIVFFLLVALLGIDRLIGAEANSKRNIVTVSICGILSIGLGILRFSTGKPFPTAFFLLINVAIIAACYYELVEGKITRKRFISLVVIFEVTLVIAVLLSYKDMFFHYIGAYNVGLLLTYFACKKSINWTMFKNLGSIGFAFFLGAGIPYTLVSRFVNFDSSVGLRILGSCLKGILAIAFAYIITRYVEQPLQQKAKIIERRL